MPPSPLPAAHALALPLERVRNLLADSVCWQALALSAADPDADFSWPAIAALADALAATPTAEARAAALARIVGDTVYEEPEFAAATTPPFVFIRPLPQIQFEQLNASAWNGPLVYLADVVLPIPEPYQGFAASALWDATMDALNKVGRMIAEMQAVTRQGLPDRLNPVNFQVASSGMFLPKENAGHWERKVELILTSNG